MNKQSQYEAAIRDLMANDSNASWNEILGERNNDIHAAFAQLIDGLDCSIEQDPDTQIYLRIWNRLFDFMCCEALGWTYVENNPLADNKSHWVDKHGNYMFCDNTNFSGNWNCMMSLIDELEGENIEVNGVMTSIDIDFGYGYCAIRDEDRLGIIDFRSTLPMETWKLRIVSDVVMKYLLFRDILTRAKKKEEVKSNDLVVIPEAQMAIVRAALQFYKHGVEMLSSQNESNFLLHDLLTLQAMFTHETSIMISKEDRENFCHKHNVDFPIYTKN